MTAAADPQVDQMRAAAREAGTLLTHVAAEIGRTPQIGPPGPLEKAILALLENGMVAGRVRPCVHLNPHGPQPMYWFAALPELVVCGGCLDSHLAQVIARCDLADDRFLSCDLCGRYDPPGGALGTILNVGPVTLWVEVCGDCTTAHGAS